MSTVPQPFIRWSAAVAAIAVLPLAAHAQNASYNQIYGRIDVSVDNISAGKKSNASYAAPGATVTKMDDNASRLGFRGRESLGGDLQAVYGLELGVSADSGTLGSPNFRNSYVGVSSGTWGTFAAGRLDSAAPTGSPIYSQLTRNLRWIVHDAGVTAVGTRVLNAYNRVSNAVAYKSPAMAGFNVSARVNLAGPEGSTITNGKLLSEDDVKQYQLALDYQQGKFGAGLGLASDSRKDGFKPGNFKGKAQAVASYDFGVVRPYMTFGQDRYEATATTRSDVNYWMVGAQVPLGTWRITANYGSRAVQSDKNGTLQKAQADVSYLLSKRSFVYLFVDHDVTNNNVADSTANSVGVGIFHTF